MATALEEPELKAYPGERYEFSPAQNEVIGNLGNSMKWVALPLFALSTLTLIYLVMASVWAVRTGAYRDWHTIAMLLFLVASCILYFALARWTLTSSLGFRAIVETRGRDMNFLMLSLDNLRKMYGVLALFVKVFLVVSVIGLILSVVGIWRSDGWNEFQAPTPAQTVPTK